MEIRSSKDSSKEASNSKEDVVGVRSSKDSSKEASNSKEDVVGVRSSKDSSKEASNSRRMLWGSGAVRIWLRWLLTVRHCGDREQQRFVQEGW